jgi:phage shock protein A
MSALRQLFVRLQAALRPSDDLSARVRDDLTHRVAALEVEAEALFAHEAPAEATLDALLREARDGAAAHKAALQTRLAEVQRLRRQQRHALQLVQELEDRAMEALRQRRLDLYDEAMRRRDVHAQEATQRAPQDPDPALEQARLSLRRFDAVIELLTCRRHALHAARARHDAQRALDALARALDAQAEPALLRPLHLSASKAAARALTDRERLRKRLDNADALAAQWDHKARLALDAGHPDKAEDALMRQLEHAHLANRYRAALHEHAPLAEALQQRLGLLQTEARARCGDLDEAPPHDPGADPWDDAPQP